MKNTGKGHGVFHWPILLLGFLVTYFIADYVHETGTKDEERRFQEGTTDIIRKIKLRFARYENSLIQTKAFILSSEEVSASEFHRYFESTELLLRYPGLLGLGFAEKITSEQLNKFEKKQQTVFPQFKVWPKTDSKLKFPIKFIEPTTINHEALGFDMYSDPDRQRAMYKAMIEDSAIMSSLVRLVQDEKSIPSPAFVIFVPLYQSLMPKSVDQRKEEITGFIYTPFRTYDLFNAIFYDEKFPIDFKVFFVGEGERQIVFDFQESSQVAEKPLRSKREIRIFGQPFEIQFSTLSIFHQKGYLYGTIAVAVSGVLVSFFISLVVFLIGRRAEEKTVEADALRAKEDALKKALNSRDQFLSVAAHELKTPLTALQLQVQFADKLSHKYGLPTLEKYRRFISQCEESVLRLNLLVNDLLDISRIDSGRLKFTFTKVKLGSVIEKVILYLEDPLRNSNCKVTTNIDSGIEILADVFKLEQVFSNLLMNSVKYAPGSSINIDLETLGEKVRITYTDSGPGIRSDLHEKVFERYERGDLIGVVQGLGLGLYISREIVRGHSGSIYLSEPGERGVKFIIELPLASRPEVTG